MSEIAFYQSTGKGTINFAYLQIKVIKVEKIFYYTEV